MLCDAHLHFEETLISIWEKHPISSLLNCATKEEYQRACALQKRFPNLILSVGIHPWNADGIAFETLKPCMDKATVIGEIGMDSVWCEVSLTQQKSVFEQQLQYAQQHHKPVILHTKGQEKTIAELIEKYPNTYLVHWYSCMDYLDLYQQMGCYFSVGPDTNHDPALEQLVEQVDLEHLLLESDGISAIAWAQHQPMEQIDYLKTLQETAEYIANKKQVDVNHVIKQCETNLMKFLKRK